MAQGIHDGTKVLLSSIELPDEPVLQYSIYSSGTADPLVHVESARRKLCTPSAQSLFSSPITRIHFTSGSPLLYVFHVASNGDESPTMALDDLTRTSSSEIVIGMAVSEQMLCDQDHGPSSGSCNCSHSRAALDRESNLAQKLFLDAVRDRLVDEICIASLGKGHIPAVRLQNGFCLLPQRRNNEWTSKWEAGNNTGLIFCEMQLHLTATHILVQPLPCRLTSLAQIEDMSSGSAILLLPHGIPAFYIQQHSADDATVSEFSESFSQNGVSQTVSKDFARCYVPFRRVNDRQDGGITTIWPRALILATPSRPSLSAFSSQSGAVAASNQRPMQKMTIASSLTSLSLEPAVNLSMLSLAMGRFVDAALKERERPKAEPSQIVSGPQTSQAAQLIADEPTAQPSTLNDALQANTAPQPQPRLGPAQSYPSPLEMITNRHEPGSSTAPQVPAPTDEPMVTDSKPEPSVVAANATEPQPPPEEAPPAQPTFTASQASLNPWDSMGGFSDGNFGFGGGASGMQSETFGSDMFTEDDFTFFDVPAVHSSSTATLGTQNGAGQGVNGTSQNAGLPDVILALSGQTSDFGKLDASLMDWSVPETSEFSVVGGMTSLNNNTQEVFSAADFDLSAFPNDPQLISLLGKGQSSPEVVLDGDSTMPSAQNQPLQGATPLADEEVEDEEPGDGFSALRFGRDHNLADEKYYNGKYSLPSPPPEPPAAKPPRPTYATVPLKDDSTKYSKAVGLLSSPLKSSTAREGDLRARYVAATHPSRAMLYKLTGTKRFWEVASMASAGNGSNSSSAEDVTGSPSKKRRLTWSTTSEAWRNPTPPADESDDDDDDGESSIGGDDEWNNEFDAATMDGAEPITPIGPYKSEGFQQRYDSPITFLQSRFDRMWIAEHDLATPTDIQLPVLSFSSAIMSPYQSNIPLIPMSVPTPVSPEAQPSSNDGPTRLATNLAQRFAREAGRNPLWNAVVVAMREIGPLGPRTRRDLWQVEIDAVVSALQQSSRAEWGKSISEVADTEDDSSVSSSGSQTSPAAAAKPSRGMLDHVNLLQPPKVHLGHGNNVVEVLPSITRFWDQLNVTPLNGPKDVLCAVLVSDTGGMRKYEQAELWLKKLGKTYAAKRLGSHEPVLVEGNPLGVAAVKWDRLRGICNTLVRAAKETLAKPLIVYVIVPNTFTNLSHPNATQVLATIAEVSGPRVAAPGTAIFMLIPEVFLSHARTLSQNAHFGMERLAQTVYDSFPRTVIRQNSRLSAKKNGVDETFDAYAFALASRRPPKALFVEKWPPPTSSTFDRYAFLHVAYNVSANGEWVVATLITEIGDQLESQVWRVDEHDALNSIVRNVLDFVLKHAHRADVEWRITLAKSGAMSSLELNAWTSELAIRVDNVEQSMHLTLLSLSTGDAPTFMETPKLDPLPVGSFVPLRPENGKDDTLFVDVSSQTFLIFPQPLSMLLPNTESITSVDFLSSRKDDSPVEATATPIMTCWLVHVFRRSEWTHRQDASLSQSPSTSSVSSAQIHALHFVRFKNSTYSGESEEHMRNIATNFYDLTILHELRTGFIGGETANKQPLHIAVVNSMTAALDGIQV